MAPCPRSTPARPPLDPRSTTADSADSSDDDEPNDQPTGPAIGAGEDLDHLPAAGYTHGVEDAENVTDGVTVVSGDPAC